MCKDTSEPKIDFHWEYINVIKVFLDGGKMPTKSRDDSAGFDLFAAEEKQILPKQSEIVSVGIRTEIRAGLVGMIRDRSGLAGKRITTRAGVIDPDYRGVWKVVLVNEGDEIFFINEGDRIAQVLFLPVATDNLKQVTDFGDLEKSVRGEGGFGSSGK